MVRPIRVDDAKLRDRRVAFFHRREILLAELQIFKTHGKAPLFQQTCQRRRIHAAESCKRLNISRLFDLLRKCRRLFQRGLTAFDPIDAVRFDLRKERGRDRTDDRIDDRRPDRRTLLLRHELYALRRRVCALVILSRQIFDGKRLRLREVGQRLLVNRIDRRLDKDDVANLLILFVRKPLDVVADEDAHRLELRSQTKRLRQISAKLLRRNVEISLPFLHKKSSYTHAHKPSSPAVFLMISSTALTASSIPDRSSQRPSSPLPGIRRALKRPDDAHPPDRARHSSQP